MSHPENSKAPAVAQQASATQCVAFLQSASTGNCILEVRSGVPVSDVMECYEEVLDGITALVRRMARDSSGGVESEAAVLSLLTEMIGAMTAACSRGMAAAGGRHEPV